MQNSRTEGHVWGVPFQRSTIVMYYNKDAFRAAGLNPDQPPTNWEELIIASQQLTIRDSAGNVTQWGIEIPSGGAYGYWLLQAFTTPNDAILMNEAGNEVYLNQPNVIEALAFWRSLSTMYKVMPPGTIEWATTPKDFLEGKAAIVWTTTGNLTNIRTNATFDFGVNMLPQNIRGGSPTGGGNFYIFKDATPDQQQAALRFIQWVTSPERAAQWSIATGYVAVTPAAWETDTMKQYVEQVPAAAVARDQLAISVAEFSTHDNQRITKALNDAVQAAIIGTKTPQAALNDAQAEAERILRAYQ